MARNITLDFTGAPAAEPGTPREHVPPGRYPLRVTEASAKSAQSGNPMITVGYTVTDGEQAGKMLAENFVLIMEAEKNYGIRRLRAFLQAIGYPIPDGKVTLDLDKWVNRSFEGWVVDEEMPANDRYPARMSSKLNAYYSLAATANGATPAATPVVVAAAPVVQAAPVAAPAAETVVVEPAPAVVEPAAQAQTVEPAETAPIDLTSSIDDLFK